MIRICAGAIVLTLASTAWADDPPSRPPTGRFVIGAGFSSDEGFIAHAEVAQDDLFHTGQKLSLSADISALRQELRIVHEVPDVLSSGLDLRTELFSTRREYPGFVREGYGGGAVTVGHRLDEATRIYARYRVEEVSVIDLDNGPIRRSGGGLHASLGAGVEYTTLDMPFLPTRGSRFELFAEQEDPRLGSDFRLMKVSAALDHARPLGPFTLRLTGRGAFVRSLDAGPIPMSERLQHDGNIDIAGYPAGSMKSGDLEANARAELELPIIRSLGISIAGFAAAGIRHNDDPLYGATGMTAARSVGAGIIWRSPIGPLRFDWAIPLDRADRKPIFLFSMGSSF
jgi:outer membrane protein insertion porin family